MPHKAPDYFSSQTRRADRFFLDLRPTASEELLVISGGVEHCASDYRIPRRELPFCGVEFVAGGDGQLVLQGRKYALAPGAVFSYGPGVAHEIGTSHENPLVKYFVDFTGTHAEQLLDRCRLAPGRLLYTTQPQDVRQLFDLMIGQAQRGGRNAPESCRHMLECLVCLLADSLVPCTGLDSRALGTLERCRAHMLENFLALKTIREVATACHVDVAYMCRLFKRFETQTPYQYLQRLRMRRAMDLLQRPDILVKDVAAELGYPDPFQFSRAFKRIQGVSPQQFMRFTRRGTTPPRPDA